MTTSKHSQRGARGRYTEGETPPSKRVVVCLPEPFLKALDAFGKANGTGRGGSIQKLCDGLLEIPEPEVTSGAPADKKKVRLQLVKSSHPLYSSIRSRHYIPDKGIVGQNLNYLIFYGEEVVGIISGASSVFTNVFRNEWWNLSTNETIKNIQLNSIVSNNVFRLETALPNLASIVLSKWRKRIAKDWEELYGVAVAGYESFIVEDRLWNGTSRNGACYRADGWELIGITKGYGDTNVRGRESKNKNLQAKKLVYCKRVEGIALCSDYETSWFSDERTKELKLKRESMIEESLINDGIGALI